KEAQLDEKFDEITQELREAIPEVAEVDNKTLKETMSEGELCLAEDKEYAWSSDEEIETVKNAPFLSEERRNKIIDGLKAKNEKFKEWAQENPQRARAWCKRNNVQEPEWLKDENAKDSEAKEKGAEVSQGKENESVSERQKDDEPAQNMKEDKPRTKGSPRDDVDPAMKKKASNDAEVAAVMGVVGAAGLGAASESLNTTQPGARKMGDSNKPLRVPTMGDKTKSAGRSL
ncbi:MAG: hypothetical protein IKZ87_04345, partial [Actinomycetaceae bacterium]|nr:hypothetical protein [Actinomycetaceae bacterium]